LAQHGKWIAEYHYHLSHWYIAELRGEICTNIPPLIQLFQNSRPDVYLAAASTIAGLANYGTFSAKIVAK
jgi:hypothetical protein